MKLMFLECLLPLHALNEVALQLQAIMRPNERKARPTCKKGAKSSKPRDPEQGVWEISDGEITSSSGPNSQTSSSV
jgi:hypothetical protein